MSEDPQRGQDAAEDERAMREHERDAREHAETERRPEDRDPDATGGEAPDVQ